MNCDALSVSGERLGIFSQILVILQTWSDATQTYSTSQEDIYNIFLQQSRLESTVTAASTNPACKCTTNAVCTNTVEAYANHQLHHKPASLALRPTP